MRAIFHARPRIASVAVLIVFAIAAVFLFSSAAQAQAPTTSTITIRTNQATVHEGGLATFVLERYGGSVSSLMVQVETWEPDKDVNGEDGVSNVSKKPHEVRFGRGIRRALLHAVPFVDGTTESGTQTLNAQVMASEDSSYQVGSPDTASITVLDPPTDNSIAVIDVTRSSAQSSVSEGVTITYTFTRSGGDTTQPLTVDIEVSDPGGFLRGDYWDTPPVMPTQVQFGAGSTTQTLDLTVPDDGRHLYLDGVTVTVQPSADYLLKYYGEDLDTSAVVYVNDNDTAQQLELNFGKDGTNDADVDEGDTLKVVVKRRQRDANDGQTASLTVRVETDRSGPDDGLEDWETDSSTSRLYKDFPLELTGSDTEVEREIEVTQNGGEEDDWVYEASILAIEDHEGKALSDTEEAQYWTVKSGFRETEVAADDGGDMTGTVTISASTDTVYEGDGVTYTLTRTGGPVGSSASFKVRTWEPSRRSGGNNPSAQDTDVQFDPWETTASFTITAYVDNVDESGTDTLKARITMVGEGYAEGDPHEVDLEIDDPPRGSALITLARDQATITEGQTGTFTLTRAGGDTTQELTVNIRVGDNGDYLRGNHWDAAPDIPTEATFAANSTTATVSLTAPDDDRDLPDAGLITLSVLPGTGYLLGNTGVETKATISTTDNDTAQVLSLDWGYLDPTDPSWEDGESHAPCTSNGEGGYDCTAGPAEGFYYYEDNRNFHFSHEFEEPWPIHFEVSRRAQDAGSTATFVVRVEHNRGWVSARHADWPVDPVTGKHYQEFPLTLTGDQRKVIGRIEILDNGLRDPNWKYTVTIKQLEDMNGAPLTADQENDYWTVQGPRTRTLRKAGEIPYPEFNIMLTGPREVQEGSQYTFMVERKWGNAHEPLPVQIRTWEPNRTNPDGTNPTEQVHNLTFPAVPVTSYFRTTLEQTLDVTVTASDDAIFETSDPLKIELLSPTKRRGTSVVKGQVAILDDDQPTIELTSDKTSVTEGETVNFTLTRGNNTTGELIVGIEVYDPGSFLLGDYVGDADGVETPTSVTFADGDATKTVTIILPDDRRDIPNSTLTFTVEEDPAYEILGTNPQTVQVADNDVAPQVMISFNYDEVEEGQDLVLIVKRIGEDKNDLEIPMTGGRDDDQRFTVIGLDPGESEAHLRYRLPDDEFKGPDVGYSFTLEPENLEFWTPTGDTTVTAKIVDNDPYRVSVRAFSTSVDEGHQIYYRIIHDGYTDEPLQVKVTHSEIGNAVGDGILGEQTHTITAGESGITRAYPTQANDGSDGDATFTVELVESEDYEINLDRAMASVTVVDKDPLPVLQFQDFLIEVREDIGTAEHTVELVSNLPVLRDVTVEYQIQEQFISDGADVIESAGTFIIPAGETTGVIEIPIIQDTVAESDETFFVYLRNPVHTTLQYGVSSLRAWGTILDDEPTVTLETEYTAINEGTDAVFTLTRDEDTSEELTVWVQVVQTAPVSENVRETVVFAAGDDTATLTIATENYRAPGGVSMTISATLLDPDHVGEPRVYRPGTTGPVLITVRDVSLPDVTVSAENPWIREGETTIFTFQRQNGEWRRFTIEIEVSANSRFVSSTLPTTITFPRGDSSVTLEIETDDDTTAEDNGEITVAIKDGTGYQPSFPSTATTTVFDNDSGFPDVRVTKSADWVNEGDDVSFTFTRSGATADPLDFEVSLWRMRHRVTQADLNDPTRHVTTPSSIMPFDQENLSLTFAAGDSSLTITRSTTDDVLNGGNSTYHARVESGADSVYTTVADYTELVWVQDDDRPTVTMTPATQEYVGSIPIPGLVSLTRQTVTLTRTGDAGGNLTTNTLHDRTRYIPPPGPDEIESGDQFGSFTEGNSVENAFYASHFYVNFMGFSGTYKFDSPHYCPDEPEGECKYRPQYVLGADTETAYRVYGALMGVRIEADQASFDEGSDATFTLHRLGGKKDAMDRPLQVRVAVTQEGDYISGTTPVTVDFVAGQSTATLTVPTTNDTVDEANGTVRAEILYPTTSYTDDEFSYEIRKYPDTPWFTDYFATTEIDDDDYILPNVSVADATGREQDGTIEFTISLNRVNDEVQATVSWATAEDGTDTAATSGTDFTADSGTVTFDLGETEKTVTITLLDDELDEAHETFNLVLSNPSGAALGDGTATGTILDDELAVAVIFDSASGNVVEGEDLSFRVKRLPPVDSGPTLGGIDPCDTVRQLDTCFNSNPSAADVPDALTIKVNVSQEGDVISGTAPATVTFQAGSAFATLVVPTVDDSTVEANGVVTAKVLNGSGYSPFSVGLAQDPNDFLPTSVRTVYDNDLTISIADASAAEGSGSTLDFAVSLNAPAPQRVTIYAATVDGGATSYDNVTANSLGRDFTAKSETITFARGDQIKTFSVDVVDDTIFERAETLGVQLSSPPHHLTIVDDTGVGTITDNEAPMEASVSRAHSTVNEGIVGPARFMVTLSHADTTNHERNPAVAWQTVGGTAAAGEDFVASNGRVNFETGETTGFIDVDITDDNLVEAALETFSVELLSTDSRLVTLSATDASYEASIRDNETLTASIIANAKNVVEGQDAVFTVRLAGGVTTEATKITFEVSESDSSKAYVDTDDYGTPIGNLTFPEGDDSGTSGTLTIPAGENFGDITYPINSDSEEENDGKGERMEVRLYTAQDGLGSRGISSTAYKAFTTILDKDSLTASIEGRPTVTEGGAATFTASLSKATNEAVLVGWATRSVGDTLGFGKTAQPDVDYTADSGTVSIAAGDTSGTFTVQTTDDSLVEGSETFVVTLEEATKGTDTPSEMVPQGRLFAIGTITDNDAAPDGVTVSATPRRVDEDAGETDLSVTVSLDGTGQFTTDTAVTLKFFGRTATEGDDFIAPDVDIDIPASESSVTTAVPFTVIEDNLFEGDENVRVSAVPATLANSDFDTITIEDNEVSPPSVTLSITPIEADESAQSVSIEVTAEFDGATTIPDDTEVEVTTAGGTATAGVDFETATTTVTIPAGELRGTAALNLTVLDDSLDEVNETLTVTGTVTTLSGKTVTPATFTILDNDTAPTSIGLSVSGSTITEGGGPVTLTVRATLLGGGTRQEDTQVIYATSGETATLVDDYTFSGVDAFIEIPAGAFYGEITDTIRPVQDSLYEGDETVAVQGYNQAPRLPVNAVLLTIHDDDPAPTVVALSVDPGSISESVGSTFADVSATIEGGSTLTGDTQVRVGLATGNAQRSTSVRSTLFSSLIIPAGEMSGTSKLLLTNLNDDVDDDDETLELNGTTDNPDLTVSPAQFVVTDDDTAGITISPNSLTITEGGPSRDYAIKLDSQPTSIVTVTVDLPSNAGFTVNPGSVTFTPQNWRPQSISVTATEDENITDEPAAIISHTVTSSDALYRNAAAGSVSVTVRDDDQNIGVTISKTSMTIEEGTTGTYTVVLDDQPTGDVTVTITGNTDTDVSLDKTTLTFTDQDWNTTQTVTVTAEHDGDAADEDDVTLTHTVASTDDSEYNGVSADSVTVSITDDDGAPPGVTVSKSSLALVEGEQGTYTVVLDSQPAGDVTVTIAGHAGTDVSLDKTTLTFTDQDWSTTQTVTVTAEHDDDNQDDDDVTLTHTVTSADDSDFAGITADSVTVSVTDDDARVDIYPTTVTVPEGHAVRYTVVLNAEPTGDVTVTINDPTDNTDVTTSPATLTFTTGDWDTPQLVTVSADTDTDDDEDSATVTHTVSGYGSVATADDVAVTVTEDAQVNVEISHETQRHTVREGRSKGIKVVLDVDPERTLVVALSGVPVHGASDDDYTIPAFVVFNPGDTEQSYTFTAVDDTVDDDDERVNVEFTDLPGGVSVGIPRRAFVDIGDNDKPETVEASFNYATLDRGEGSSITLGVALDQPAERSVTVPLSWEFFGGASIADTGGLQHSVTFGAAHESTGWSFSVAQDRIDERGEGVKLTFGELPEGVIAGTPGELIITFVDDDDAGVTVSPTTLTVAEGEDGEYTVVLDSEPTSNVTVTIGGTSGTDITLNPSTLTFTTSDWDSAKTMTVSAGEDDDADSETITLTHTVASSDALYEGISAEDVVVTVTDPDPDPGVKISKTALTIAEGASDTYTVVLNTLPASDVTVTIAGHSGTDASTDKTTLTFTDQDWGTAQTVTVSAASDTDTNDEDDVTLTHTVASTDADYNGFSAADVIVSITDDDGTSVRVAFGAATYSVDESDDMNTPGTDYETVVTVTLSADPGRTVTIPIVKANQGGASDSDYSGVPANVVFNAGETSKTFTFAATADSDDDDGESVKLTFGSTLPDGVTEGTIKETTISITDDDDPAVTVAFGAATYSVDESDDASTTAITENEVQITVTLSADPERPVTIPISRANQDGASDSDYSGVPANVSFASGETSKTFTFAATSDTVDDDGESVKLSFSTLPTGVTEGTTNETVVSITDDDVPSVTVSFENSAYSVDEGSSETIKVILSAKPERAVAIPVSATFLNGVGNSDFSGAPVTLNFAADDTEKTITFAATADTVDDDGESVKLTFNNLPTGVTEGTIDETVISINDDDLPADVDVEFRQGSYTVAEGSTVTVTVTLSEDPEQTVTIPISKANKGGASNSDYSGVPASVVFNSGETSKTFTFAAKADDVDDDGESVKLDFATLPTRVAEGTINETVISIIDDDLPTDVKVEFEQETYTVAEGSTVTVTVTLSEDPERAVAIPVTKANQGGASNADYSGVPASVSFASGETSKTFSFAATSDTIDDDNESVKLTFGTLPSGVSQGTTSETTVSITDDDVPSVSVSFGSATYSVEETDDASTTEDKENEAAVAVSLSADPERTVTIPIVKENLGGAEDSDYSGVPSSVVFNSGETSKAITFVAAADTIDDDGESVRLTFGTLPDDVDEGTIKETTISINDDDAPSSVTVNFGAGSYSVSEGGTTTVSITLSDDPEKQVTVPLTKTNQDGASDSDYSGIPANVVFAAGDTEKTFTVSAASDRVSDAGESVKLTFDTDNLPTGVAEGTVKESVVSILDVAFQGSTTIKFEAGAYGVGEGSSTTVKLIMSQAPGSDVVIPISKTDEGGASSADYSGVPASVTFGSADTERSFTFSATADTVDDDGESVKLEFGTLPSGITSASPSETTVSIIDDDDPADRLMSLVVSPKDIDGFDSEVTSYMVGVAATVAQATITATPYRSDDTITINGTDATNGEAHTVDLSAGLNTFEVVVSSVGSTDPATYKVYIGRGTADHGGWKAGDDLDTLRAAGNTSPSGIWSDGTTIWISDVSTATLYAYSQADGTRDAAKDIAFDGDMMAPTGIWSDGTTIWVIGLDMVQFESTLFAYTLGGGDRNSSSDISLGSDLMLPVDLWSDGVTMWIVDSSGTKLYAYTLSGGARDTSKDIDLDSENAGPGGVWSDGTTIWVTDSNDHKLYAYDLSGERVAGHDIDLHSRNSDAFNLWGNTDTIWVANNINDVSSPFNRIFTYNNVPVTVTFGSATYSVEESDDTSTTDMEENEVEITVTLSADAKRQVVVPITATNQGSTNNNDYSGVPGTLTFESGDTEKTFSFTATEDTVEDGGESVKLAFGTLPPGVAGGTNTEAVVSIIDDDTGVSFERMAYEASEGDTVDIKLTLSSAITKEVTVPLDKTELGGVSNSDYSGIPGTVKFESGETEKEISFTAVEDEIDDDGESVKLRFGSLPTGVVPGVNDETIVTINDNDNPVDRLISLVVSPKDIDGFDPEVTDYMVGVAASITQVTITATPYRSDDTVTINGTEVTNGSAHAVGLSAGLNTFAIVVNSSATVDSTTYTVYIGRGTTDQGGWKAADDLDTLRNAGNTAPAGIWSNGTTMWIADSDQAKLYAYALADGSRDSGKDITLHSDNSGPAGIWSDETTIWVVEQLNTTVFAYTLSDGSRDTGKEFTRSSGNAMAWGIWSNGTTMWVVDWGDDKLYAYTLADGSRDSDKDFNLASGNASPRGVWSNGTTMWIVDVADEKLYAYDLSGGQVEGHDINLHSSNPDATGIWGEDDTAWVVNSATDDDSPFDRVFTYNNIPVTVSFEQGMYTVAEGNNVTVKVVLSADPERTVIVPLSTTEQDGASSDDYSGVPNSLTFNAGDTEKSITFSAATDSDSDDGESVKLTFGTTLPTGVAEGTTEETVVSITDDDAPTDPQVSVTVSFESSAYSLMEGSTVTVTVNLSEDPERTVTIPLTTNNGPGASEGDYSGVPDDVVFNSGDTEKSFSFIAEQDSHDEDEETVTLGFGAMPSGVSTATPAQAAISIRDSLRVSFGASTYQAHEGEDAAIVVVRLNEVAPVPTTIPIELTLINGVTNDDFDGVPSDVAFAAGEQSKSFTVTAIDDDVEDNGEMIRLAFGDMPAGVVEGSPSTTTVELMNMENGAALAQCPDNSGRRIILDSRGEITETNASQFWRVRLDPYRVYLIEVFGSNPQEDLNGDELPDETRTLPTPMVMSVQMGDFSQMISHHPLGNNVDLVRGSDATGWHQIEVSGMGDTGTYRIRVRVNNVCHVSNNRAHYRYFGGPDGYVLDIPASESTKRVLEPSHVSTGAFLGDNWNWYWDDEPDVDWFKTTEFEADQEYNIVAWAPDEFPSRDQATDLKIVGIYDSEGTLILGTTSTGTGKRVSISFEPASDGTYYVAAGSGSGDRTGVYKLKIEKAAGSGNDSRGEDNSGQDAVKSDRQGSDGGESEEDGGKENKSEDQTENTPATGSPTVTGTPQVGETLTAETSRITDNDGLDKVEFIYQWLAGGTVIGGADAATYTLTADAIGKRITVRVSFTDDEGNAESLTSAATSAVIPENPPPAPINLTATHNEDGSITLNWEAPDDDTITGYQILRRLPQEGQATLMVYVADTGSTATTYMDTGTAAGTRHVYRVKALNATGASQLSNWVRIDP